MLESFSGGTFGNSWSVNDKCITYYILGGREKKTCLYKFIKKVEFSGIDHGLKNGWINVTISYTGHYDDDKIVLYFSKEEQRKAKKVFHFIQEYIKLKNSSIDKNVNIDDVNKNVRKTNIYKIIGLVVFLGVMALIVFALSRRGGSSSSSSKSDLSDSLDSGLYKYYYSGEDMTRDEKNAVDSFNKWQSKQDQ